MLITRSALAAVSILALSTPAFARGGGDREPAGGAFMSSYPEQGSTAVQRNGPPRSVDIPRDADGRPDTTGSVRRAPADPYGRR